MYTYVLRYIYFRYVACTDLEPSDARRILPCWDEPEFKAKFKFTVWARPDKIRSAEYALDIGIKLLGYFEDYFGIPYSLPKMDMIAIPKTSMMAMENWGLITYDENLMLWDAENSSIASQILVALFISHELAHQDELFILDELIRVLDRDTSMKSRPVIYSANTTTQIKSMFDIFTYIDRLSNHDIKQKNDSSVNE
ncbi:unnamed protein product [Schistosoma mattheei]|uniref:Uncharacterized protein n=1 Tax=Schistosoma mattheei TaxID=31246 RepID=A0A3P8EPW6_9TREM|nr:unnamed protein product [Schistosoma mattheei]